MKQQMVAKSLIYKMKSKDPKIKPCGTNVMWDYFCIIVYHVFCGCSQFSGYYRIHALACSGKVTWLKIKIK